MPKFEAHITLPRDRAETVEKLGALCGWTFSQIDGDPLMGKQAYCYLTAYKPDAQALLAEMREVSRLLAEASVMVLQVQLLPSGP